MNNTAQQTNWNSLEKITFRFFFMYFGLFIIFQNNGAYPYLGALISWFQKFLENIIAWIGRNILNLHNPITMKPTGSGDTTFDWALLFTIFSLSILVTLVWSILDKKRKNYNTLWYWLMVAIRFYIGLMLINYGAAKLFKTQFSYPSLYRLTQNYGNSSPMGLAWTFLGFSKGYNIFMGIAEVAAVLLLFRRTVTIGAIITLMTSANVMAVNYFYDVPVKITSTHLVLMTLFLLVPNAKKLIDLFFRKKEIRLYEDLRPNFKNKYTSKILTGLKYVIILISLYGIWTYTFITFPKWMQKPDLYGVFEIEEFQLNGKERVHYKDSVRWEHIKILSTRGLTIKKLNGKRLFFRHNIDTLNSEIELISYRDSTKKRLLTYELKGKVLSFNLVMENDTLTGKAIHKTEKDYLLMNRGFHWISEKPFNR